MFTIPENWSELTPKKRQEARFNSWASAEIEFASPEAEQGYRQRVQMIKDAIQLKKPERVPVLPWWGVYPAEYSGITVEEAMYDYEKLDVAWRRFNADFMPDAVVTAALIGPGKVFDILDYKLYHWPGHGTPPNRSYQCIEGEYMSADEYDLLIADPNPHIHEHAHKYDEIVLHWGGDSENPEDLGGEIEFGVGGQPLTFATTTGLFVPKGLKHGPLTWKKVARPHIQMAFMLNCGDVKEGWVDSGISGQKA